MSDPVRQAWDELQSRNTKRIAAYFRITSTAPPDPEPVRRADGTVYDGTGEKPPARDVVEQVKAQERSA